MDLTIYTPDRRRLAALDAKQGTVLFRAMLYADAGRMRLRNIRISVDETTSADGGIDASAEFVDESGSNVAGSVHFQLKTGETFKPWQESAVKKELFGSATAKVQKATLAPAVKACLDQRGTYVVVCFGHDLLPAKAHASEYIIRSLLKKCGYPRAGVKVWGVGELVAILERYPSLCLDLNGHGFDGGAQTLESWAMNAEMLTPLALGEPQKQVLDQIGAALNGNSIQHVRLLGEPGLGKTRLALETLKAFPTLGAAAIYVPQASDFQSGRLFNELLRPDRSYRVTLVIDECEETERASIYSRLKGRPGVKLITIDHGPDASSDSGMQVMQVPPLEDGQINAILEGYVGKNSIHLHHWVPWCEGSARVAHALGENLSRNPGDLLRSPATVDVWRRYIEGYQEGRDAGQTRTVLEHIALFRKFGFRAPVNQEGKFIAGLAQKTDPSITPARFNRIVERLVQKRILQGGHTLRIVPKALHVYLWREWWNNQGQGEDLSELIDSVPASLKRWFSEMLIYANGVQSARDAIRQAVKRGAFRSPKFVTSEAGAGFLSILAEADPDTAMRVLADGLGPMPLQKVESLERARQSLTSALCKLAAHERHFARAAELLAKLTYGEKSTYSNNARGSFCGLFQLNQGPTQAAPVERLQLLRNLFAGSEHDRLLAVDASKQFLNSRDHTRVVGVEYQGMEPAIPFWMPRVYGDLFGAWRLGIELLEEQARPDDPKWQETLSGAILQAAAGMLGFKALESFAIAALRRQLMFPHADVNELAKLLVARVRHNYQGLPSSTISQLRKLLDDMGKGSFQKRFDRFVVLETYDEDYKRTSAGGLSDDPAMAKKVAELAGEFVGLMESSTPDVQHVVCAKGHRIAKFGSEVAKLASDAHDWLLFMVGTAAEPNTEFGFFSGYMERLFVAARGRWESLASALLEGSPEPWRSKCVIFSGVTPRIADRVLTLERKGVIEPELLKAWSWSLRTGAVSAADLEGIARRLLGRKQTRASLVALDLVHSWRDIHKNPIDDDLVWAVLTDPWTLGTRLDGHSEHEWQELAKGYLGRNPKRSIALYEQIIARASDSRIDVYSTMFEFASGLAFAAPAKAWGALAPHLDDPKRARALTYWLGDGRADGHGAPIEAFNASDVLNWIAARPGQRALLMVDVLPRTLEGRPGALTFGFIDRFGADAEIRDSVRSRFWTGSSSGPLSLTYAKKRDAARAWLTAASAPNVRKWLMEFIDMMGEFADEARIREEREF